MHEGNIWKHTQDLNIPCYRSTLLRWPRHWFVALIFQNQTFSLLTLWLAKCYYSWHPYEWSKSCIRCVNKQALQGAPFRMRLDSWKSSNTINAHIHSYIYYWLNVNLTKSYHLEQHLTKFAISLSTSRLLSVYCLSLFFMKHTSMCYYFIQNDNQVTQHE